MGRRVAGLPRRLHLRRDRAHVQRSSQNPGKEHVMSGSGTREDPWVLKTPPGTSEYRMWRDEEADPPTLVCEVGSTKLGYQLRCIEDLHTMLKDHGDWIELGSADEQKPAKDGTVEAWAGPRGTGSDTPFRTD